MKFIAYGHTNVLATHKTTLEFTKDAELTKQGDCILAVRADYDLLELQKLCRTAKFVKVKLCTKEICDELYAVINPDFSDAHELVIRLGEHVSPRTFAIRATKAAKHIKREIVECLKNGEKIEVTLEAIEQIRD